jgi:hypothetical protein
MIDRILDAPQTFIVDHVPSDAAYEQIAKSLIKHDLWRDTRIGATDHNGKGILSFCQFRVPFRRLTKMLQITVCITAIALLKSVKRFVRGDYQFKLPVMLFAAGTFPRSPAREANSKGRS